MVIPRFVNQAMTGQPITVYGDGRQSRCFTFVGDVIRAVVNLVNNSKSVGQVFNIGSSQETTISDLAKMVRDLTHSSSEIVYIPYNEAYEEGFEDMPRRVPDISKIKNLIGYEPTLDLTGILKEIIKDCQMKTKRQTRLQEEMILEAVS
jgi:UDP-glucose 4-epimerase